MENLKMLPTTGYSTESAVKEFRAHAEQHGLQIARISRDSTSYYCRYSRPEDDQSEHRVVDKKPQLSVAS